MSKINFVGDLILGDQPVLFGFGFDSIWNGKGYKGILSDVESILTVADFNVANFEAVIRKRPEIETVSSWSMCCDDRVCKELANAGINIVSIANNHSFDYGEKDFENTISSLEKNGIQVIGKKESPGVVLECDGKRIGLIAVSYLKTSYKDVKYFFNPERNEWIDALNKLGRVDKYIAYVHWGNEFIVNPTEMQIKIMNDLLSIGIDDIIGHHSHVLQTKYQTAKENHIFFSIGNFLSDYWQKRIRKTEIVQYDVQNDKYYLMPCVINVKGTPCINGDISKVEFELEYRNNNNIFISRMRMRVEYLIKIIANFYRIKEKKAFIKWLIRRIKYVLFNCVSEIKNPDIIYEKYER